MLGLSFRVSFLRRDYLLNGLGRRLWPKTLWVALRFHRMTSCFRQYLLRFRSNYCFREVNNHRCLWFSLLLCLFGFANNRFNLNNRLRLCGILFLLLRFTVWYIRNFSFQLLNLLIDMINDLGGFLHLELLLLQWSHSLAFLLDFLFNLLGWGLGFADFRFNLNCHLFGRFWDWFFRFGNDRFL